MKDKNTGSNRNQQGGVLLSEVRLISSLEMGKKRIGHNQSFRQKEKESLRR